MKMNNTSRATAIRITRELYTDEVKRFESEGFCRSSGIIRPSKNVFGIEEFMGHAISSPGAVLKLEYERLHEPKSFPNIFTGSKGYEFDFIPEVPFIARPSVYETFVINDGVHGILKGMFQERFTGSLDNLEYSEEDLLSVALQVSKQARILHKGKIAHRDIKNSNIFYIDGVCGRRFQLADFGISGTYRVIEFSKRGKEFGKILGTPLYLSPSLFMGDRDSHEKRDVYALGITLACFSIPGGQGEILSQLPENQYQMYKIIWDDELRWILGNKVPNTENRALREIIFSSLSPRENDRPTFDEIVTALR
jgi:serine/threonine protein kinase